MTKFLQNAGSYRHPVTFQKQSITTNDYGEQIPQWDDVVTVKAGIYPVSGKDYISAVEVNSEITTKVNLRYVPGLSADMRIMFGTRIFTIIAIINFQEMNKELQVMCKEFL
ncbi:phage head closure protein [Paenibacillus sp. OV219]|uniref:phage head closure protein n=1 Tax=Paenibacillus sp. OV219 TaxID=1884377 RepID=UPI0008C70C0E|nr:phage head closure protein [Paenibacillus sp. OV219]SEN19091.1 phage head-tail adaptor, putative, SPP1 family [Paenibacillus sp. OV219]